MWKTIVTIFLIVGIDAVHQFGKVVIGIWRIIVILICWEVDERTVFDVLDKGSARENLWLRVETIETCKRRWLFHQIRERACGPIWVSCNKHLVVVYVDSLFNKRKYLRHHKEPFIGGHPVEFFAALWKDKYHIVQFGILGVVSVPVVQHPRGR